MVTVEIKTADRLQINNQLRRAWHSASWQMDLTSEFTIVVKTQHKTIKIREFWLPDVIGNIGAIAKENSYAKR